MSGTGSAAADLVCGASRLGGVRFDLPRTRPVPPPADPAADMGYFEVHGRFSLEQARSDLPFVAAHLVMGFDDPRVRVPEAAGEAVAPGGPMAVGEPPGGCGWLLGDPLGLTPIPPAGTVRATLCAPADLTTLSGFVRLDATVLTGRGRPRRAHGGCRPIRFETRPPEGWAPTVAPGAATPATGFATPAVRLCVAVDTESYSRFTTSEAARSQQRLLDALVHARGHAGLREADVDLQHSGDGQFAILPAGIDESVVIPRFVTGLRTALASTNADLSAHARLRLRVALHRGHVAAGVNGWIGYAPIAVHRLLDSAQVRAALLRESGADFALIVSEVLFTDVIADGAASLDPASFDPVEVRIPEKNFAERARVYVPGC
ncbi:hypothetical protein ACFQ05_37390 [Amycolatopsis umgeniensis]|uniref:Guanylate cyclase domain-containing protein n=1 Tax=Amycolatopsis umgeniensis TaxID=336628 RepID=A0A841AX66_9PSEU|nr:hypothetical protein [Amycolatopsis umgeniensis]MBB5851100.1 hypothetical protein [Amycolatopsis umgeniensis]